MTYKPKNRPISRRVATQRPLFTGKARPKYVSKGYTVFDAALDRMRWLFDEFDNRVMVSISGGKDSTVVMELGATVARERGVKLHTMWLDQECEFQATVDYQRYVMYERDDIEFHWYQVPFKLENSTNHDNPWLNVWGEGEEWVRPREPNSIHENTYGEVYFKELLAAISSQDWDGCLVDGMRVEESPARRLLMTSKPMYKWCTWVNVDADPKTWQDPATHRFRFHPVYDWSYRDVWKAIHENKWRYNKHYDHLFQYGVKLRNMRVSNFHHETALTSLHYLQEIEPETWEAATRRLEGISTYGHLNSDQYPSDLPYMFSGWEEYMHYLIDNLVQHEDHKVNFRKQYRKLKKGCSHLPTDDLAQVMVGIVIGNDLYGTALGNYMVSHRKPKEGAA